MRPDFGCGISDHVFDVNGPETSGAIAQSVRDALSAWEPRIELVDVEVAPDPQDAARLLVAIDYLVRSSNSRLNLVYPFYLE